MITLYPGSRGSAVATLQRRLNDTGAHLVIDHIYGTATAAAVRAYQRAHGLVADGIAGTRTQQQLLGATQSGGLDQAAIEAAAAALDCDVACIHAVVEVESGASGYLSDGRVDILYERHIMYRQLKHAGIGPAPYVAAQPDIVNPEPGGYIGGAAEYRRLARAAQIDSDSAIESTSWGRFQIMGFHWKPLGYASASAFAEAMQSSEAEQMQAFVRFLQRDDDMPRALREHDWAPFARRYNGPAYAEHDYDGRLARAYARHASDDKPTDVSPPSAKPAARRRKGGKAATTYKADS